MSHSPAHLGSRTTTDAAAPWRSVWFVGACIALLLTLLAQTLVGSSLRQWESGLNDLIWRHTALMAPERRIVLVDIDERSVAEVGPWPWSRDTQARLMDRLGELGVRQQIWDVVFAGPGVSPKGAVGPANQALAQSVAQHRPVLAQVFGLHQDSDAVRAPRNGGPAGALPWSDCPEPFAAASVFLGNHAAVLSTATSPAVGHITPRLAHDGVLRHQPAVVCFEGRAYPALVLAALGQSFGSQNWVLRRGGLTESDWVLSLYPSDPPSSARPAASQAAKPLISVPLEANGDLPIAWQRHPDAWTALSAADVLAGRVPSGMLNGAWVVVGGSAFGLNDRIATPLQASASGFLAHAQILSNLIDETVPVRPRAHQAAELLLALNLMVLMALIDRFSRRKPRSHASSLAAPGAPVWLIPLAVLWPMVLFLGHVLLLRGGLVIGWMAPSVGVAAAALGLGAWAQIRHRAERERLYGHLASYLPARVAQVIAGRKRSDRIEARAAEAVVMFADIRNFSAYCESRPPAEAAAVLHAFYSSAFRAIEAHGGVLEALQGDSIIAVWGLEEGQAPSDAAVRAVAAATALLASSRQTLPDPAPAGLEPLALGIGLECGPCMSGSIGPAERRTHLVMGRTVTIASRLVDMTVELAHPILMGEGLASQLGGTMGARHLRSLGNFMLEGLRVPHHVYAWVGGTEVPWAPLMSERRAEPGELSSQIANRPSAPAGSGSGPQSLH